MVVCLIISVLCFIILFCCQGFEGTLELKNANCPNHLLSKDVKFTCSPVLRCVSGSYLLSFIQSSGITIPHYFIPS